MAYRDDLETRRAHVRRLEARLEALREEERLVRSLGAGEGGLLARITGGPERLERSFVVDTSADELGRVAPEVYGVDGMLDREDGVTVWRGHPSPGGRTVTVRLGEREDGGAEVIVRDEAKHGAWLVFLAVSMIAYLALGRETPALTVLGVLGLVASAWASRAGRRKATRRRAREALALEEALREPRSAWATVATPAARVRVADAEEGELAPRRGPVEVAEASR